MCPNAAYSLSVWQVTKLCCEGKGALVATSRVDVEVCLAGSNSVPGLEAAVPVGFGEPWDRPTGHLAHGLHSCNALTWLVDACGKRSREQQRNQRWKFSDQPSRSLLESGGLGWL
jgi:hypothetical protein